jgi:hypothetical protein
VYPGRGESHLIGPALVGLLIYRTLIGQLPWDVGTTTALLRAHQYTEPEPLPAVDGLPSAVAALIARCLQKRPDDRPSGAELAHVLAGAVAGVPAAARGYVPDRTADSGEDTTILPAQHLFTDGIGRIRAGHAKAADGQPANAGRGFAVVRDGVAPAARRWPRTPRSHRRRAPPSRCRSPTCTPWWPVRACRRRPGRPVTVNPRARPAQHDGGPQPVGRDGAARAEPGWRVRPGRPCRCISREAGQRIGIPEIARAMTSRWISDVPSKMV